MFGGLGADPGTEHEICTAGVDPIDADPVVLGEALVQLLDGSLDRGLGAGGFGDRLADDVHRVAVSDGALLDDRMAHRRLTVGWPGRLPIGPPRGRWARSPAAGPRPSRWANIRPRVGPR